MPEKIHFLENTLSSAALSTPKANAGVLWFQVRSWKAGKFWKRQPCPSRKAKTSTKYERVCYCIWTVILISKESWTLGIKYPEIVFPNPSRPYSETPNIQQRICFSDLLKSICTGFAGVTSETESNNKS